jgi:hypothetical protein
LRTGTIDGRQALRAGSQVHQLIEVLLRDFFEPLRTARLFNELFPGELFNVSTTPARVRKAVERTRAWLRNKAIPVSIVEDQGFYSLRIDGSFSFLVPLTRASASASTLQFEKLRARIAGQDSFSNQDVCLQLELSTSAAQTLINWGIHEGYIVRMGDSKRNTRYKLSASVLKSA